MIDLDLQGGGAASSEAIAALEGRFGNLPDDYKTFLNTSSGAKPNAEHMVFYEVEGKPRAGAVAIRRFESAEEISGLVDEIEGWNSAFLPFAHDSSGNYFCLSLQDGRACIWDHELGEYIKVADSFSGFLEVIEEFDLDEFLRSRG